MLLPSLFHLPCPLPLRFLFLFSLLPSCLLPFSLLAVRHRGKGAAHGAVAQAGKCLALEFTARLGVASAGARETQGAAVREGQHQPEAAGFSFGAKIGLTSILLSLGAGDAMMSKMKPTPEEEPKNVIIIYEKSGENTTPGDEPKETNSDRKSWDETNHGDKPKDGNGPDGGPDNGPKDGDNPGKVHEKFG